MILYWGIICGNKKLEEVFSALIGNLEQAVLDSEVNYENEDIKHELIPKILKELLEVPIPILEKRKHEPAKETFENLDSDSKLDLAVYPNPFKNSISFNYEGEDSNAKVIVYDLLGQELLQTKATTGMNTLNLSALRGNTFIIKLIDKNGSYSQKVIRN